MAAQLTFEGTPVPTAPTSFGITLNVSGTPDWRAPASATFTLVIYEASWLQQQLIRTGLLDGPINGLLDEHQPDR
jgi:hypothetical protein